MSNISEISSDISAMEEWVPSESNSADADLESVLADAESDIELVDVDESVAADVVEVSSSTDSSSYPDIPTFSTSKDSVANSSLSGERNSFSTESSNKVVSGLEDAEPIVDFDGLKLTSVTSHSEAGAHLALKDEIRKVLEDDDNRSDIDISAISDVSGNTNAMITAMIGDCIEDIKNESNMDVMVTERALKLCQLKAKQHRIIHASWNASSSEDADPPIMVVDLEAAGRSGPVRAVDEAAGEGPSAGPVGPLGRRPKACALCKGFHLGPKSKVKQGCNKLHGFELDGQRVCLAKDCVICGN